MWRSARWRILVLVLCLWVPVYGIAAVALPVCGMVQSTGPVPEPSQPPCCQGCPFVATGGCVLCGVTSVDHSAAGFDDRTARAPLPRPLASVSAYTPEPLLPPPILP